MWRICTECRELFDAGQTDARRHPACEQAKNRAHEERRGTTAERGLTGLHRRISEQYKAVGAICVVCHRPGTDDNPITAGHVTSRLSGGQADPENYVPLCRACNSSIGPGTIPPAK